MGKYAFGVRALLWVYNDDPSVPLKVRFSNLYSGNTANQQSYSQIFGTSTVSSSGQWERVVCDIPPFTAWQSAPSNGKTVLHYLTVEVYSADPLHRHTFYVDDLDFFWYSGDTTVSIASQ